LKNLGHPWRRETVFPFFFFLSKIVHLLIEIDPRGAQFIDGYKQAVLSEMNMLLTTAGFPKIP
jgi:predicted transcriptional regulator